MTTDYLNKQYSESLSLHEQRVRTLKARGKQLVTLQLILFAAAIGCAVGYTLSPSLVLLWVCGGVAALAGYSLARHADGRNTRQIGREESLCGVYRKELAWLKGDFKAFDNGARYADPHHEYAFDMDIFGRQGLYQRICRCATKGGADLLAHTLSTCALGGEAKSRIDSRREATMELTAKEAWRTEFMSHGIMGEIDTDRVRQAVTDIVKVKVPSWMGHPLTLLLLVASIVFFYVLILLSIFTPLSSSAPTWWGTGMFFLAYMLGNKPLHRASKAADKFLKEMRAYVSLVEAITQLDATTADNQRIKAALGDAETGALASLRALRTLVEALDRRGNLLGMTLQNILFLNDLFLARRFLRWQQRHAGEIDSWLDAVSEMDERVSMATWCYNHSELTHSPEIVSGDKGVVLEAQGLTHPFLGAKAVANDFTLEDGHFYIVTGANMAGKSTFLRSLGVNYILAMAGMPVFAVKMRASVFSLFSSMRTSDDLAQGISYFNAELLRLKQLLAYCRQNTHTLIILDEILKGTNSLDKLNGSRMFLEAVSQLPVTGVIATHDLELSRMAEASPTRFHNHCFEIGLADKITYTYKITEGVARNQNATFLLKGIIEGE